MFSLNFENDFAQKYKIENTERYKLIDKIKDKKFKEDSIKLINYRIFDKKYCFYEKGITSRPVPEIMKHLDTDKNNIALITTRMLSSEKFTHAQITDRITERCYISNRGSEANYIFPLYLYQENRNKLEIAENQDIEFIKVPNFSLEFKKYITEKYAEYTPEQILGYIYAILYSPSYRSKYSVFLKNDFPKIPFVDDENMFFKLSEIGNYLIDLHTFSTIPDCIYGNFIGDGNYVIDKINYSQNKLFINETQYFENTPENVYNFTIGNYKIIERYLKDRKGNQLQLDEINQIENIVKSLFFTIEKMNELESITKLLI